MEREFTFRGKTVRFFPSVGLKLTGECRLYCPFCCEPERDQPAYPVDNFKEIARILRKEGTERLCFTGGDPLLYKKIGPLLRFTKKLGFRNLLLTSDGSLLKENYAVVVPYIDAIRFSIHDLKEKHDHLVKRDGAFRDIEEMVTMLTARGLSCYITTVVLPSNISSIKSIAEWCFSKNIAEYYLFGMMKSGRGGSFIEKEGEVPEEEINKTIIDLRKIYPEDKLKIVYYSYKKNAECILIYGDGRVVIDPYPVGPNYQIGIGNILKDQIDTILEKFNKDPENYEGYTTHLGMYDD